MQPLSLGVEMGSILSQNVLHYSDDGHGGDDDPDGDDGPGGEGHGIGESHDGVGK